VVKNLGVIGADVTGNNDVGGVAGYVSCGTVQDCYVTGAVTNTYTATLTVSAEDMTPCLEEWTRRPETVAEIAAFCPFSAFAVRC
jgi:hypothetical protein